VAVPPGGVAVAGADRITVAGLAVDESPGMAVDGVIADQGDGLVGRDHGQDDPSELAGQAECGPLGRG